MSAPGPAHVHVLVVGGGPAGLTAAIACKKARPEADVLVLEKAAGPGNHVLSGAVLEPEPVHALLDLVRPGWREKGLDDPVFSRKVEQDEVMLLLGPERSVPATGVVKLAGAMGMPGGGMLHHGDYIVSAAALTAWLARLAEEAGVEVLHGFGVDELAMDAAGHVSGAWTVQQGLDREGRPQPNHRDRERLSADVVVLAEGCRGFVTEDFVKRAGLVRTNPQLYAVGVKEVLEVSPERFAAFGPNKVAHSMGYPLWTPLVGPGMFGGGFLYPMGENRLAVGMILGADWKYRDVVPQDALVRYKEHPWVRQFTEGGRVVEAGGHMIPEGGYYAIPRDPATDAIGRHNVMILGDSAGLVDMHRIKGLHNALWSGLAAGKAAAANLGSPENAAVAYTAELEAVGVLKRLRSARNFRQLFANLGTLGGLSLSTFGSLLPRIPVHADHEVMTTETWKYSLDRPFDKDTFVAQANVEHREDQPCHCEVLDPAVCERECTGRYDRPCVGFCLAGVYERHGATMEAVNPSNCIHCKTCETKCPFQNLRWHVPEGGGGPRYEHS